MPLDVNPKLSKQEAVDELDPLDPLECPLDVGRERRKRRGGWVGTENSHSNHY